MLVVICLMPAAEVVTEVWRQRNNAGLEVRQRGTVMWKVCAGAGMREIGSCSREARLCISR